MRLTFLTILFILIAVASAAPGAYENESNEFESYGEFSNEFPSEESSAENSTEMNRPSRGLFGRLLDPFRSLIHWGRHRHHNHNHPQPPHMHGHHHNHRHGHHQCQTEPPSVITSLAPTKMVNSLPASTTIPSTRLITSTVLTTSNPPATTTTITAPETITSTTPRYNDPDNELIYDIDLRFRT